MSIKIALAGNPNCGKTTLFNALTGSNQFVGNWPGVTVEKKEGAWKGDKNVIITDLPGIYSLSPYTLEEVVARNYLISERPDVILNIVDGTNIERNLYLSTQLMELGIPVVMAVNMSDILEKNGDKLHLAALSERLDCDVVAISALKGTCVQKMAELAVAAAKKNPPIPVHAFDEQAEKAILSAMAKLGEEIPNEQKRFFAVKLLEGDDHIVNLMYSVPDVTAEIRDLEEIFDDDVESIIANERYTFISSIINACISKKKKTTLTTSDKIDKIVTNRVAALPIFVVVMILVYYVSVSTVGSWVTDWTNDGIFGDGWHLFGIGSAAFHSDMTLYAAENIWTQDIIDTVETASDAGVIGAADILNAVKEANFEEFEEAYGTYADSLTYAGFNIADMVEQAMVNAPDTSQYGIWVPGIPVLIETLLDSVGCADWLKSLILDGIVGGVGAVLGFVPQMLVLFLFLAFLEACGYMARVAFIMDRIFRKFGLSGKSFIPMLIGSGCGVPGIMASRTIENDRDRKMTIMTTTFVPCGAKLPIIALISAALFGNAWWVAPSAYFIGIAAIICSGIILKKTKLFAGEPALFIMELPAYHVPTVGNVLRSMWERGKSFIRKAGTIILLSSILIWAGSSFGDVNGSFGFDPDMKLEASVLGMLGGTVSILFTPLGFNNVKATIATIMGLVAKEEVVGVFGVLDFEEMTQISAYSFLVFNLLCAPCFAAMGAIRREMNNIKWFWLAIGYQCGLAYVVSLCIYQIGMLVSEGVFGMGTVAAFLLIIGFIYLLVRPYKESSTFDMQIHTKALAK